MGAHSVSGRNQAHGALHGDRHHQRKEATYLGGAEVVSKDKLNHRPGQIPRPLS